MMNQSINNILSLGRKEFFSLLRDPVMLILIIWSFTFSIYSGGEGASQELKLAPVAVVDHDHSQLSRDLIQAIRAPYFKTPEGLNWNQIDKALNKGDYTFVLLIPSDFERKLKQGEALRLEIIADATRSTQAFTGIGYLKQILYAEIQAFTQQNTMPQQANINLNTRYFYNPNLTDTWFGGLITLVNNITLLSMILAGAALIREREHGTLEHLLAMPVTPLQILIAKLWSMAVIVLAASFVALYGVLGLGMGLSIKGAFTTLLLAQCAYLFCTTTLGFLLSIVAKNMPQFGLLVILVIMPLHLLSGGNTPFESMPLPIQLVMQFTPTPHFVAIMQSVVFRDASLSLIMPALSALIALGSAYFLGALYLFRKRI